MGSNFFIDKKLIKRLEKDIKKRKDIEERIDKDLSDFNEQIDDTTLLSTFKYIEEHGNKKQKEHLEEIRNRYNGSGLIIDDTLCLVDWYEKMCDYNKNK